MRTKAAALARGQEPPARWGSLYPETMTSTTAGPCPPAARRRPMVICLADPTYIVRDSMSGRRASDEQLRLPLVVRPAYRDLLRHPDTAAALAELHARFKTARRRLQRMDRRTAEDAAAGRQFRDSADAWVDASGAAQTTRIQYLAALRVFRRRGVPRDAASGTAHPSAHVPARARTGSEVREGSAASRASSRGPPTMWGAE